ncbi:glutathionylspermidine synthase family protein [Roseibium sp. RKSG952]|uniref:glutathionylspermidine synthase family protein n=1 Tax=Roseibium sp. RKSG952 TaxID=2529384 RepID=UPI0012BD38AC|nr:glutathionylspermidine synthase family protein [Roseibium sp. RKSG952]MTH96134.1 glutathionylspermidine synthase family protein [Roseibium sp. RKSG952]
MKRIIIPERPGWRDMAEELGFVFHTMHGEPYWDETSAYVFTLDQIEKDIEDVTTELFALCTAAVDVAVDDQQWMEQLKIPEEQWDWIRSSWKNKDLSLYGRFDLSYDGNAPSKMLEFNADTPTSVYEAGYFQWIWFEQQVQNGIIPAHADQFNSIQEKLIKRFGEIFEPGCRLHFSCCKDTNEDRATVDYLADCAKQADILTEFVFIEDIGVDAQGRFADNEDYVIDNLFKLYPYEDMFREEFGPVMRKSGTNFIEPAWKSVLSNKGMLALLWALFPGHPNLLESHFEEAVDPASLPDIYVRKPYFSREGANVDIIRKDGDDTITEGDYGDEGFILQEYRELPKFGEDYTVIGSWIVGDEAAGIGIREDKSKVTKDLSRFVPHIILD